MERRVGLAAGVLLSAAALAVGASFGLLFEGNEGAVTTRMLGAVLVGLVAGNAGAYRFALVPLVAAFYGVLVVYGPAALNPFGGLGLVDDMQRDVPQALATMYAQPIPYEPQPGLVVLLAPIVVLLAGLAASAALYEQSPVFSVAILGVTLGVISTVSFESGVGPYFAVFLVSGVALLLLTGGSGLAGLGVRGVVAGLVVVGVALALPQTSLSETAIRPGMVDWTEIGAGETARLATEADVGPYLNSARNAELMRVYSEEPLYWRGGTLDEFDGVRWSSTLDGETDSDAYGEEIASTVETETVRQNVEIMEARTDLVFGGYNIQEVTLPYAEPAADGSWSVEGRLEEGETYGVISKVPQPTEEQLSGAGTDYAQEIRSRFLQMPDDLPEEVSQTAGIIGRDYSPDNPYETARTVQRYLLYDGGFTYNLDADYRRADQALEEFLGEEREGFCTQFATSMALVLREMDIPTRVVYGATTGEEVSDNEYVVRGANMHTWVEVYFPGVGWYPFDPTPGLGVTGPMQENAPAPDAGISSYSAEEYRMQGPAAQGGSEEIPWANPGDSASQSSAMGSDEPRGEGLSPLVYALPLVLVALSILAVPLTKGALLARRRPGDYYRDLVGRLEDSMMSGRVRADAPGSLTPTERLSALARTAGLSEEPFLLLARSYTEHLYSPSPASDSASAYAEALRAYRRLPLWRRALGVLNPASLVRRGAALLSRRLERRSPLGRPPGASRR